MNSFNIELKSNIIYLTSSNIAVPHGFSTRHGGISSLPHTATMNLAYGRGDDEATVKENMRIFCTALGIDSDTVVSAKQIHSTEVMVVTPENAGLEGVECDGFVTRDKGIALCVKIADCVPILFCDEENGVIGACHAGWRGTAGGIATVTVEKMLSLGAEVENIQVAIGPCIHPCCYEVSSDFYEQVSALRGEDFAKRHIKKKNGSMYADLTAMNKELLMGAGIPESNISISDKCTCCEPDLFHSHRATGGVRGTMAALISL